MPSRPPITVAAVAVALALLMGLQPVSTDLYLPALPQLARELSASMNAAQLTMAALILAFGIAQMLWGPIADRVGRRPVLLLGLLLYTRASAGCALAGSIDALVVWRIAGTLVCRGWITRYGMAGTVWRAAFFTLAAGPGLAAASTSLAARPA